MKKFATFQVYFCLILTVVLLLNSYENAEAFVVRSRTAGKRSRREGRRELYKNSEVKLIFGFHSWIIFLKDIWQLLNKREYNM